MKRLIFVAMVGMVTVTGSGCYHWFQRGASCGENTCYSSGGAMTYPADPYMEAPNVYSSPQGYLPTPQ